MSGDNGEQVVQLPDGTGPAPRVQGRQFDDMQVCHSKQCFLFTLLPRRVSLSLAKSDAPDVGSEVDVALLTVFARRRIPETAPRETTEPDEIQCF